jgi:DNA-binding IclR family transcriptional regulator
MTDTDTPTGTRIRSVSRAARLLLLVAALPEEQCTIKRLADELATSVPTVYHLVNTLIDSGLLTRDERRRFQLGISAGALSVAYQNQTAPAPELLAPLRRIVELTGENAYLSAWRHGSPVVVASLPGANPVQVTNLRPGYQGAAHARASGKVLLAFSSDADRESYLGDNQLVALTRRTITDRRLLDKELTQVAASGYATESEEHSLGVACISVPVMRLGLLLGAYTIQAPVERYRAKRRTYLGVLRRQAAALSDHVEAGWDASV